MSIDANIKTAEEHLEADRELDRLFGTLTEDCVHEESLLAAPVRGKADAARYYQELI
ncbi:MAG: hypothetical protein ACE5HK_00305 [Candidatus Methylomirabilales bacterium]